MVGSLARYVRYASALCFRASVRVIAAKGLMRGSYDDVALMPARGSLCQRTRSGIQSLILVSRGTTYVRGDTSHSTRYLDLERHLPMTAAFVLSSHM